MTYDDELHAEADATFGPCLVDGCPGSLISTASDSGSSSRTLSTLPTMGDTDKT